MPPETCPSCGGSGRPRDFIEDVIFRLPCRECGGSGYVEGYNSSYPDDDDDEYYPDDDDDGGLASG